MNTSPGNGSGFAVAIAASTTPLAEGSQRWFDCGAVREGSAKAAEGPSLRRNHPLGHAGEESAGVEGLADNPLQGRRLDLRLVVQVAAQALPGPVGFGETAQIVVGVERGRPRGTELVPDAGHFYVVPQNLWMSASCRSATAQSAFRRRTYSVVQRGTLRAGTLFASDLTRKAQKVSSCRSMRSLSLFRAYVQYKKAGEILSPKMGRR
jgi:hypothetical protein